MIHVTITHPLSPFANEGSRGYANWLHAKKAEEKRTARGRNVQKVKERALNRILLHAGVHDSPDFPLSPSSLAHVSAYDAKLPVKSIRFAAAHVPRSAFSAREYPLAVLFSARAHHTLTKYFREPDILAHLALFLRAANKKTTIEELFDATVDARLHAAHRETLRQYHVLDPRRNPILRNLAAFVVLPERHTEAEKALCQAKKMKGKKLKRTTRP